VKHGLKLLKPLCTSFTPCLDGRYLLLWPNDDQNYLEISKFSKRDADAYPRCYFLTSFSHTSIVLCIMSVHYVCKLINQSMCIILDAVNCDQF